MDIASNLFLGRELRRAGVLGSVFRMLDKKRMRQEAAEHMADLKIGLRSLTSRGDALRRTASGCRRRPRRAVRPAASWSWTSRPPPSASRSPAQVLDLIRRVRDKGMPVVLISHNMPHVFEIADRIHVHRLGQRVAVVSPKEHTMSEVVSLMTGALRLDDNGSSSTRPDT